MTAPGWDAVLDALDADVARAEALAAAGVHAESTTDPSDAPGQAAPLLPPAGIGPLPEALRPRAEALLERLAAATDGVVAAIASVRSELNATQRITTSQSPTTTRSHYLDTSA